MTRMRTTLIATAMIGKKGIKPIGTKPLRPQALLLGCALALFAAHVFAATPSDQGRRGATTETTSDAAADMAIDADRAYSFVEPRTGRITALLIANDRPSMTVSIDPAADAVDVSTTGGKLSRVSIADLADAYAQGDAERRAEFLVSVQRASGPRASAHEAAYSCVGAFCKERTEDAPTTRLASIVRWAADNVGSRTEIAQIAEQDSRDAGRDAMSEPKPAQFDPWQTGTQVPELVRALGNLFHF